jgi:hypothetical protein
MGSLSSRTSWMGPQLFPLVLAALAGCARHPAPVELTAVPDAQNRLSYQLPADSASLAGVLRKALEETVCLVRSGSADECREGVAPPSCDPRSTDQLRPLYAAAFDSIPRVVMSTPFAMNDRLRALFPGSEPTTAIRDARRASPCKDWTPTDGTCAAVEYRDVMLLFRSPSGVPQRPTTLEVYLAGVACRADIR